MTEEKDGNKSECCPPTKWQGNQGQGAAGGGIYFLAMIGAAVYFVQQASGFWPVALAILKAIVWPAFLLYKVFQTLHI